MKGIKKSALQKRTVSMKHTLKIKVSKEPVDGGVVSCRTISMREKLLCKLFGCKRTITILIPGDSVESVSIGEISEGGAVNG